MSRENISLAVQIGSLSLVNPLLGASGCFGYGQEFAPHLDFRQVSGFVTKGLSLKPRPGNLPPRICETEGGMLNSIGLSNPGLDFFLKEIIPNLTTFPCHVLVNLYGETIDEFVQLAEALDSQPGIAGLEINVSCPNVKAGGVLFGKDPQTVEQITRAVRNKTRLPLWIKLSPNVADPVPMAQAAEQGGADTVCLINTLQGMAIDPYTRRCKLGNGFGGLSGPAIKPIGLFMVHQVSRAVNLPVVGLGGIISGTDVVEYLLAGATAVQVGTANFYNPAALNLIAEELKEFCLHQGIPDLAGIIGGLKH